MSVKTNYIYTVTLNLSQLIFPLLTFPYVTRILGPEGLGIVNFATSFITYFILLSAFGINIYGQREAAKCRNDRFALSKVFNQMLIIHIIATMVFFLIYVGLILVIKKFSAEPLLYASAGIYLWLNVFSIEWFFLGIEEFRYITIRTLITRIVFTIAIFLLINDRSDYILYYVLIVTSTSIPFLVNMLYATKFVTISVRSPNVRELFDHAKKLVYSFLYMGITSLYASFSIIYLGFISTDENVGYFSVANKLYSVVLSFFTALTVVLYPRLSSLMAQNNVTEFKRLIAKSFEVFLPVSISLAVVSILVSREVIHLFSGEKFEKSVLVLQLYMPLVVVVGLAQIYVSQILFPLQKDKAILTILIIVASISVVLNIVLVSRFTLLGAIVTLVISESMMTSLLGIMAYKYQKVKFPIVLVFKNLILSIPYVALFLILRTYITSDIGLLLGMSVLSGIYFTVTQCFLVKNVSIITLLYQGSSKLNLKALNNMFEALLQKTDL